jgi:hypothetical protein
MRLALLLIELYSQVIYKVPLVHYLETSIPKVYSLLYLNPPMIAIIEMNSN